MKTFTCPNRRAIREVDPNILLADGLDRAFLGLSCGNFHKPTAVYSYPSVLEIFRSQGMTNEEAEECAEFNVLGAYVGEYTPIFVDCDNYRITRKARRK